VFRRVRAMLCNHGSAHHDGYQRRGRSGVERPR
jgi:hypothetical protein